MKVNKEELLKLKLKFSNLDRFENLRTKRQNLIENARRKIFGYETGKIGEKQFLTALKGPELQRWYFPSKYLLQDISLKHYFGMQADRFKPKPNHPCIDLLSDCIADVFENRVQIKNFIASIDEKTFCDNQTLQDLYSLYKMMDSSCSLSFELKNDRLWKENNFNWFQLPLHKSLNFLEGKYQKISDGKSKFDEFLVFAKENCSTISQFKDLISSEIKKVIGDDVSILPHIHAADTIKYSAIKDKVNRNDDGKSLETAPATLKTFTGFRRPHCERDYIKIEKLQADKEEDLKMAFRDDPQLESYYNIRNRFIEPLYYRRRLSFLDRMARNRIKSTKERNKYAGKHFVRHPDTKDLWPDNKGLINRQWPSPYH